MSSREPELPDFDGSERLAASQAGYTRSDGKRRSGNGERTLHIERTHRPEAESASVGDLLRRLATDVPDLVVKELALARAELTESMRETRAGLIAMVVGVGVLMPGLFVLLMAAVYGLATVITLWASALIVGAVVTVIGAAMLHAGKKKLEPDHLKPERSLHQWERTKQTVKGASHEHTTTH
jgi:uncharacterized membrane protein YqjE